MGKLKKVYLLLTRKIRETLEGKLLIIQQRIEEKLRSTPQPTSSHSAMQSDEVLESLMLLTGLLSKHLMFMVREVEYIMQEGKGARNVGSRINPEELSRFLKGLLRR